MITVYKKCTRYIALTALVVFVVAFNCACSQLFSVKAPYADSDCIGRNYDVVRLDFAEAGFDNIEIIALKDLDADESELNGAVVSVTVDDLATFDEKTSFEYSSKVIIKYHSYKQVGIPVSYEEAKTIDASELETAFREAGFVNITLKEKRDLDPATMTFEFENRVSIGGLENFSKNDTYTVDSEIVIVTHRAREEFKLELVIEFEENLIFSRYGITIEIGGKTESLSHGKDGNFKYTLERGKYKLTFSKKDSKSIKTTVEIDLSGNTKAAYKISCHSDKISVKTLYIENQGKVGEGEAMIPVSAADCEFENYKDIENKFKKAGFTNIKTKILYDIVWGITQEGEVEKVAVGGKTNFKRGDVFAKDAEIIITYHMKKEDDPKNFITMKHTYYHYWDMDYYEVEQEFLDMGFSNVSVTYEMSTIGYKEDGTVKSIYVNGKMFNQGEKYHKDDEVAICYWKIILTENNNSDFRELLGITNQTDTTAISKFVYAHIGDTIEFNGCVAFVQQHENYKTRFDVAIVSGNYYDDRVYGPLFAFENVNFGDMNVSGTDTVTGGMNFIITAKILGFSDDGGYIILEPISLKAR